MWTTSRYTFDRRRKMLGTPMLIGVIVVIVLFIALVSAFIFVQQHRSPLPNAVAKKISYVVFFPDKSYKVQANQIQYDASAKVLTMTASQSNRVLTITQQPVPSQFTDIPQYYPALLDKLHQYASFGTANGSVYLTHPTELNGGTEAVLSDKGTFVLVYAKTTMTEAAWREFFNNLRVLK